MANSKLSHIAMDGTTLDINDAATAEIASRNDTAIVSIRMALNGFDLDGKHIPGLKENVSDLQDAMKTAQTAITGLQTDMGTAQDDIASIKSNMVVSVLSYGADPTGTKDSATAFANAIAATPVHGTCYIPAGEYRINNTISITKPLTLVGNYFGLDPEVYNLNDGATARTPLLHAYTDNTPVVQIQSQGVNLRNIGIKTHTANAGIKVIKGTGTQTVPRNILLDHVFIDGDKDDGTYLETGFTAEQLITSTFNFCRFVFVQNGFMIGSTASASTSIHFDNCWVESYTGIGYRLVGVHYSAFTACAADGSPWSKPKYAYAVVSCDSIAFTGCGAETATSAGVQIVTSTAISVISHMFTGIPYGVQYSGACQCTMIGCAVVDDNYLANVSGDYNIIGCKYSKYKDDGTDKTDANKNHIAT
jgi:hypothetical protein